MNAKGAALPRPLVLVGFMASGKSTVGQAIADRLSASFSDTDAEVEQAFGRTISEIFRTEGEGVFRAAEREAILRLLDGQPRVVAAGGGTFIDRFIREQLKTKALTIWLDTPFETIFSRLTRSSDRPLAADRDEAQLHELWIERRAIYSEADVRLAIRCDEEDPAAIADIVLTRLALS